MIKLEIDKVVLRRISADEPTCIFAFNLKYDEKFALFLKHFNPFSLKRLFRKMLSEQAQDSQIEAFDPSLVAYTQKTEINGMPFNMRREIIGLSIYVVISLRSLDMSPNETIDRSVVFVNRLLSLFNGMLNARFSYVFKNMDDIINRFNK